MEAHWSRVARCATRLVLFATALMAMGAGYRTPNFVVVSAPSPKVAQEVCRAAEQYRKTLAEEWLGAELPRWSQPCPIRVRVAPQLGAGGVTSFMFENGQPFGWQMSIQGSYERVLDSVLPHEITHTIFATHFGRPLPRWADEGACTTVEHVSEKQKHQEHLLRFLTTRRGIPFNQMFAMTEYPKDIMPLYAQGHSVVDYLLQHHGKRRFVDFVGYGMQAQDWNDAIHRYFGYQDLSDLQIQWLNWLREGQPALQPAVPALASTGAAGGARAADGVLVSQAAGNNSPAPFMAMNARAEYAPASSRGTSAGSWYARQRHEALHQESLGAPGTRPPESPRIARGAHPTYQSTTRPPQAQQVPGEVLDWGNR